jgi:hypothetical protein
MIVTVVDAKLLLARRLAARQQVWFDSRKNLDYG